MELCIYFTLLIIGLFIQIKAQSDSFIKKYPSKHSPYYDQVKDVKFVLTDEEYQFVYFSAVNAIYSLSIKTNDLKRIDLSPDEKELKECRSRTTNNHEIKCKNHIKELQYDLAKRVLVCGTYDQRCYIFNRSLNGLKNYKKILGYYRVPKNYEENATVIYDDPYLIVGGILKGKKYNLRKVKINPDGDENFKQAIATRTDEATVLYEPNFVSSYVLDSSNYTYFFFTEYSTMNGQKKTIASRVGRICKYDDGLESGFKDLTSFLKSELLCYRKGERLDKYYDKLQRTFKITEHDEASSKKEDFLYGIFTSSTWGGSAVCRYRIKDIINVFTSSQMSYVYDESIRAWAALKVDNLRNFYSRRKCDRPQKMGPSGSSSSLHNAIHFPLLYDQIKPFDNNILYESDEKTFTSLYIEDHHSFSDNSDIGWLTLFLGTYNGEILKFVVNKKDKSNVKPELKEVDKWKIRTGQPIHSIKRYKNNLYVAATTELAMINMHRCNQKVTCNGCISSYDPYCAWDTKQKICTSASNIPLEDIIIQRDQGNTDVCPPQKNKFHCEINTVASIYHSERILECSATSDNTNIKPKIKEWKYENQPLLARNNVEISISGVGTWKSRLMIKNFTSLNAGSYECVIEMGNERNVCGSTLNVPSPSRNFTEPDTFTTNSTHISNLYTTTSKTSEYTIVYTTGAPIIGGDQGTYKKLFYGFLVAFLIVLIILLCCACLIILKLVSRSKNETETDGTTKNGHPANVNVSWLHISKRYNLNRKDSASKELIKKKNQNPVYKDTTLEMNEVEEKSPVKV